MTSLYVAPLRARFFSHVTNVVIGSKSCPAVESSMKFSKDSSVRRKTAESDGMKSIIGYFQLFGDKSRVSLFVGVFQSYILHITVPNIFEKRH